MKRLASKIRMRFWLFAINLYSPWRMAGTSQVGVLLMAFVTLVVGISLVLPLVVGISLVAGIPLVEVLLLLNGWPCSPICLK